MSLSIRKIPDDEPDTLAQPATPPVPPPPVDPQAALPPKLPLTQAELREAAWQAALRKWFGDATASKILAKRRCLCGGRLRPYTDPKDGAAGNRAYGVTPGLRCAKCGRLVA